MATHGKRFFPFLFSDLKATNLSLSQKLMTDMLVKTKKFSISFCRTMSYCLNYFDQFVGHMGACDRYIRVDWQTYKHYYVDNWKHFLVGNCFSSILSGWFYPQEFT